MQKPVLAFTGEDSQLANPKLRFAKARFDVNGTIKELNLKTEVGEHARLLVFREGAEKRTRGACAPHLNSL
jgi:hypothetical protein